LVAYQDTLDEDSQFSNETYLQFFKGLIEVSTRSIDTERRVPLGGTEQRQSIVDALPQKEITPQIEVALIRYTEKRKAIVGQGAPREQLLEELEAMGKILDNLQGNTDLDEHEALTERASLIRKLPQKIRAQLSKGNTERIHFLNSLCNRTHPFYQAKFRRSFGDSDS
jgi:hypothetical protein